MKRTILLCLLWLLSVGPVALAQQCATMEMDSILRAKFPTLGSIDEFERTLQQVMARREALQASGRITAGVITIPVVVHVVHNGEAVGQGSNISAAQVQSQIDVLNEDFRNSPSRTNAKNDSRSADVEIEFCLASVDPRGVTMRERGIDRYNGGKSSWKREDIEGVLKPQTYWDPDKYYNIWVVPDFTGTVPGGTLLGYAQFPVVDPNRVPGVPSNGPASTDGVVIRCQAFGSSSKGSFPILNPAYSKGRTLTHETGHWLGLRHIWGDGSCAEDYCSDTPPADGPSSGCPVGRTSCGGQVSQIENYMDYTDDVCMNLFTACQANRMRTVMEFSPRRQTLLQSNVCGTVVAAKPEANFSASKQLVLRGGDVSFNDLSSNFPTGLRWTFDGGEPGVSTERNPVVTYNAPGTYGVTLVATNARGSDTLRREAYIQVSSEGLCNELSNFGNGTPTLLRPPSENLTRGYVAGHNNLRHTAKAEYFGNNLGYLNMSGATVRFAVVKASQPDAVVKVSAWNARGVQGAPGALLETKLVPVQTIQQDIAAGVPTRIVFDRNVPLFGRGFYVGVELEYSGGTDADTVALITTAEGQSNLGTAWERDSAGVWQSYTIARGQNIAHDIRAVVGMNPSVQVFGTEQFISAGESVTLNARGASLFSWEPAPGLSDTLGPQVIVRPTQTTTYIVNGSGLDLCNSSARYTVYVTGTVTGNEPTLAANQLVLAPNPSAGQVKVSLTNAGLRGEVQLELVNVLGSRVMQVNGVKQDDTFEQVLEVGHLAAGTYVLRLSIGKQTLHKRLVKL